MKGEPIKLCKVCNLSKPVSCFYKTKDGYHWGKCKSCCSAKRQNFRPKTYKDYLKDAGLLNYYERSMRFRNDTMRKYH